ncbi:flagellar biosynthetic protein FliO [Geodermatophilus sp. YIM 151500]|uniref:FliO/MopB family protein n=1 Tax=Geodermatophilus sp. YIM 151500 TaxID=2984531 RepID=UPI0021E374D1|nr:flagellar biosynthetic protein FliO [Geodermatophilus sp. YIM 151500]MCV2489506.1 flagellar biosynthetic protein FliO [Geodermatophilus sp. YIM 151500]
MTWMIIRLLLSLAFVAAVLWFAARVARQRGLGSANGLIEVVARQRMGRSSTVNVVRIADVVLVVGATEEQVTLLAEVDADAVESALQELRPQPRAVPAAGGTSTGAPTTVAARSSTGVLAGSVLDRGAWGSLVNQLRDRTVRRS